MKLDNATVLITGANRGIGLAFAEAVLARGAPKVYAAAGDVTVVINNAGVAEFDGLLDADAQTRSRPCWRPTAVGPC